VLRETTSRGLLISDVFYFTCRNKIGAELHIYLESNFEEGTYHKRLFRGPSTNAMKGEVGWSQPLLAHSSHHPTFPPPRRPLSGPTPPKLHPAMGTRPPPHQAAASATGGDGRPERAPGQRRRTAIPPPQRDCVEAVR